MMAENDCEGVGGSVCLMYCFFVEAFGIMAAVNIVGKGLFVNLLCSNMKQRENSN